jgi:gliding motility-associated-like protein
LGYDSGPLDGRVLTANINTIPNLDLQGKGISDLTGIEDFIRLTMLNCQNNLLTGLNVSMNTGLTQLFCSSNSITAINVSPLIDLQIFWCLNNQLYGLDVSINTKLISLVCENNQLTSLNVTNTIKDIAIFDHYGKLLKSLRPNVGWNGTFNGKPMETNDYWYVITFQTSDVLKGHFTLKR